MSRLARNVAITNWGDDHCVVIRRHRVGYHWILYDLITTRTLTGEPRVSVGRVRFAGWQPTYKQALRKAQLYARRRRTHQIVPSRYPHRNPHVHDHRSDVG